MSERLLYRISIAYLVIPFIIFCAGWLRLIYAVPVIILILLSSFFFLSSSFLSSSFTLRPSSFIVSLVWVLISGVGGYFFQNWDHHWRNAVLRDLILFEYPVIYSSPERGPVNGLVYYVGYWLPAALTGKLLGWKAANFALFLWTWLGVWLTMQLLSKKAGGSIFKVSLLFIFFSGMDSIGALAFAKDYPTLFPPIQHLEVWGNGLQYSSFTTQLFWVFNQAVPAWLCLALLASGLKKEQIVFVWSLCFFFAPIASVGMALYVAVELFKPSRDSAHFSLQSVVILLSSALLVLISYLYFSANAAAQERGVHLIPLPAYFIFFLLEGGLMWLWLAPHRWRDLRWIVTGLLLFFIPFVQIGSGNDFAMRASIAPLFYLMLLCGETIFQTQTARFYKALLLVMLFVGALTPLYEINRSIYRTYEYYFVLDETQRAAPVIEPATHLDQAGALEYEHPNALVADEILSLQYMKDELSRNFIANIRDSFFFIHLSR